MSIRLFTLLILAISFYTCMGQSQETLNGSDRFYGLDQTLHNGKKYTYAPPPGCTGNQYFESPFFAEGAVTIEQITFSKVRLNYDIYNQLLLLQFPNENSPWNVLEISRAWLRSFSIGNKYFELLTFNGEEKFYQVLGEGQIKILYYWRKTLELENTIGHYFYKFSPGIRDFYIVMDGQLIPVTSKRALVKLFPPEKQGDIRSYLRKNKVNLKKSPDKTMTDMITHIGHLK